LARAAYDRPVEPAAPEPSVDLAEDAKLRGRRRLALATYVAAVALTSTAYIGTFQNASIAAPRITGTASTGGLPSSAAVAGTALAVALLSSLMAARGRRVGIMTGIGVAVLGSLGMLAAILAWSFPLLIGGALLTGFGNASIALSRYAAADMYPVVRRAGAVGTVVWGTTIGAVAGPNLMPPANQLADGVGLPHFTGGFILAAVLMAVAVSVALLGPRAPASAETPADPGINHRPLPLVEMIRALLGAARGRSAVLALVSGQLVMALLMTMTPYQLNHTGHSDTVVGFVISAHTLGMFALSPVSGHLTERYGAPTIIMAGFATLAVAGLIAAAAPSGSGTLLMLPLFLLGFGWNLGFIAGSTLLASGAGYVDRARLQGVIDAFVWSAGAIAGVVAGFVVELAGFAILSVAGAAVAVLLGAVVAADRRASRAAQA
jgi:MFS family permease